MRYGYPVRSALLDRRFDPEVRIAAHRGAPAHACLAWRTSACHHERRVHAHPLEYPPVRMQASSQRFTVSGERVREQSEEAIRESPRPNGSRAVTGPRLDDRWMESEQVRCGR